MNNKVAIKFTIAALIVSYLIPLLVVTVVYSFKDDNVSSEYTVTVEINEIEKIDLNLEEYVIGVVASEMPAYFEPEALKVQAILARTYVVQYLERGNTYITDTTTHQVYSTNSDLKSTWGVDYNIYYQKIKNAVQATKGMVIMHDEQLIEALYFSSSNGKTQNSEDFFTDAKPYLRAVEVPSDKYFVPTTVDFTYDYFKTQFNIEPNEQIKIQNIQKNSSDYVSNVTINDKEYTGKQVMDTLKLKSNDFNITLDDQTKQISFVTRGFGHCVGLSQYGANAMAKDNKTYQDIIKHFYKDTNIVTFIE